LKRPIQQNISGKRRIRKMTRKETVSGKIGGYLLAIGMLVALTAAPLAEAWQVTIKNSCNKKVDFAIKGHHLFWLADDCSINDLHPGETKVCTMPGGICIAAISGIYCTDIANGDSCYNLGPVAPTGDAWLPACWNINAEVKQANKNSCRFVLK
jgi:hypothetical protein